jgi:hypothetical protein
MARSICAVFATALLFSTTALADGVLVSWSGRDVAGATSESFDAAKAKTVAAVLEGNRSVKSWPEAYYLAIGANAHRADKTLMAGLIEQLGDTTEQKLTHTSRLIVWERIASGDILFEGKGLQISDDVFTVAGRANWLLRTITERNFGYVTPRTSKADVRQIQARWRQWLAGEEVADFRSPYGTTVTGLEELRNPQALEALIGSLRPSERKQAATAACLRTGYNLETVPAETSHPAHLCDPDTYTHNYLAKLTDIQDKHDTAWWDRWWSENASKLEWQSETGTFRVKQ